MDKAVLDKFVMQMIKSSEAIDDYSISQFARDLVESLDGEFAPMLKIENGNDPVSGIKDPGLINQLIEGFRQVLEKTRDSYEQRIQDLKNYTDEVEKTSKLVGRQNLVLSYFYQASQMLSSSLDSDTIISMIVEMLSNIFDSCICCLYTIDENDNLCIPENIRPTIAEFSEFFNGSIKMAVGEGCEGICINEQVPFQIYDVYSSPFYKKFTKLSDLFNFQSILSVPLIVRDRVEGCISIYSPQKKFFPEEEIRILSLFSDQAALAIENARLYQQTDQKLKQRVKELSLMHRADQAIINNEEIGNIGAILLEGLEEAFPECSFALDLTRLDQSWWKTDSHFEDVGPGPDIIQEITKEVAEKSQKINRAVKMPQGHHIFCSAFPIILQNDTVGAIYVIADDPDYLQGEVGEFAQGLLSQISIALEKNKTVEQLVHAEKMNVLGSLMSGIAHELNSPLSRILSISESFREEKDIEEVKKYFDLIIEESLRCKRIIEDFLAFARKYKADQALCDINSVVVKTLQLWKYQKKTDDMNIRTELAEGLPKVRINSNRIEQVFLNLIVNAYHALAANKNAKILMIKTFVEDGKVCVSFQDNGPGISQEIIDKIFQPFFTTKPTGQGTGLGLSLSRDIIREHNGEIKVESQKNQGARFSIYLIPQEEPKEEKKKSGAETAVENITAKILIADDDLLILKLVSRFLSTQGHTVKAVRNGSECLKEIMNNGDFDLIISDMIMPDMRGDELIEELKIKQPETLKKVILCTGDILEREKVEEYEAVGVRLLYKPFEMKELKKKVDEFLSQNSH